VKEFSAFVKSIDYNHPVAIGDEGFYNKPHAATRPYQGRDGIDFDANIAINTIDVSTFHSYPTPSLRGQGGNEIAYVTSQTRAGKPVILEEFGVITNQPATYTAWLKVLSSGLLPDMASWFSSLKACRHFFSLVCVVCSGDTPNDGYTIYPDSAVYSILTSYASALKSRS